MIPALPNILHQAEYKAHWHWEDGKWYPVANDDAPEELKEALCEWRKEIEDAQN